MGQFSHPTECWARQMKLLKYVMTVDSGLAPNPFFGLCSLALCTPNHMRARLKIGDWVLGHTTRAQGNRLIYAMRITKVLDMTTYYAEFPRKRPKPHGSREEQCGDAIYRQVEGRWVREPSACHNSLGSFKQDQGCPVFIAEGADNYWYFGANITPMIGEFADRFPSLVKDRQGISYVSDKATINGFRTWLVSLGVKGCIGFPRDPLPPVPDSFLIAISPEEDWITAGPHGEARLSDGCRNISRGRRVTTRCS
jgi:hypothetical protein